VRWQIDYQNGGDDGPGFATVRCRPFGIDPELFSEHELAPGEITDFYRIQNNTGWPVFGNFTSTAPILGFPDTATPDRLVYGVWPSMTGSAWNYFTNEGANADFDSATLVYFGYLPQDGLLVAPGATVRRSVVIFSAANAQSCGTFIPGSGNDARITLCRDECATIGATASDNCGIAGLDIVGQTPGSPACAGNPCAPVFPDPGTFTYDWKVTDLGGNSTTCSATVEVIDRPTASVAAAGPLCAGDTFVLDASGSDPRSCPVPLEVQFRDGAQVLQPWGTATTFGPVTATETTTYDVDVRCRSFADCPASAATTVVVVPLPLAEAGPDPSVCRFEVLNLAGGASSGPDCPGGLLYEWRDGATVVRPAGPDPTWAPPTDVPGSTVYTLEVRCAQAPGCAATDQVTVEVRLCPLAVTFDRFAARARGDRVEVSWRTAAEEGTDLFLVERAPGPGGPFTRVGGVPAHGPGIDYAFLDPLEASAPLPWYRIVEYLGGGRGDSTPAFRAAADDAGRASGRRRSEGRRRR
jgi:hypothetical protein